MYEWMPEAAAQEMQLYNSNERQKKNVVHLLVLVLCPISSQISWHLLYVYVLCNIGI